MEVPEPKWVNSNYIWYNAEGDVNKMFEIQYDITCSVKDE